MQTIKPAKGYLFCKPEEVVTTTKSGFILSESAAEKPKIAEVINVGSNVTQCKSTDKIVYKSYSTTEIKLNDDDYFLIAEDDVLGTVLDTK